MAFVTPVVAFNKENVSTVFVFAEVWRWEGQIHDGVGHVEKTASPDGNQNGELSPFWMTILE